MISIVKMRSGKGLLLLLSISAVALLSLYWFDYFHEENSPEKYHQREISSNIRIQKISAVDNPCLCSNHDSSDSRTLFETDVLPLMECCHPSIGNGFLATVVYSDAILMNGLYNGQYGNSHRARIPSTASIQYHLPANTSANQQRFTLDVEQGVFIKFTQLKEVNITHRVYAHQYYNRLVVNEIIVTRNPEGGESEKNPAGFVLALSNNTGTPSEDITFKSGNSSDGDEDIRHIYGQTIEAETNTSSVQTVHVYWTQIPPTITLPSTEATKTWTFITAVSNTSSDALSFYEAGCRDAASGSLFNSHRDIWIDKWDQGRIDIDGDLSLGKAIYGSLYYILSSLPPLVYSKTPLSDFHFYGLSPSSLADGDNEGHSYHGHVFWDQETWMYSPIAIFHPSLARKMLGARTAHMPAAAQMAKINGYDGLKFPWEMAYSGYEVCPLAPYGTNELHINGDIALAVRQYLHLTGDTQFLTEEGGMELVEGLARFWASKAQYESQTDSYSILDVMGPDEYHKTVNNSVYTNSIAQISLRLPAMAANMLTTYKPNPEWAQIADKLVIVFDKARNYHPEFEGYMFTNRVKQADVILLGYPLMVDMSHTVRENDLWYYDTVDGYHVTDINGPAMTWSMYVIGWLELGNKSMAATQLKKSLQNVQQPFKIWTEKATSFGVVNFITGMGGFLQSIIYGYGGFRIKPNSLTFNFTIPPSSSQFNITGIYYQGSKLNFKVNQALVLVNRTSAIPSAPELEVLVGGESFSLKIGQPITTQRAPGIIQRSAKVLSSDHEYLKFRPRKTKPVRPKGYGKPNKEPVIKVSKRSKPRHG